MNRKQAIANIEKAIAATAGMDAAVLSAHRERMIAGWKTADADLAIRSAQRKAAAAHWKANMDCRIR